jgi:cytochrome c5
MKKIISYSFIIFLAACSGNKVASTKVVPSLSQADADRGAVKYPGYTLADLTKGKSIYEANCGTCHNLKSPGSRDEKNWIHEVNDMVPKVNKKAGTQVLGDAEKDLILKYLVTMGPLNTGK